jgi:Ca2+-binding RTX toxin-like protein
VIRQGRLIGVVGAFLVGCAVLVAGGSGVRAEGSQDEQHTEATNEDQGLLPGAASEEDRCEETRTIVRQGGAGYATNDVPGCPVGTACSLAATEQTICTVARVRCVALVVLIVRLTNSGEGTAAMSSTAGADFLYGQQDDDVLYGGDSGEILVDGGKGEDVVHGADGNDYLVEAADGQRDKLYCGKGSDHYSAENIDYVDSSCEEGEFVDTGGPPLILLACAALLLGSSGVLVISRYVIHRAS